MASSPLPPSGTDPAAANFVQATSGVLGNLVAAKSDNNGRNIFRLESLNELLRQNGLGHRGASIRCNGIDIDVVLGTLERKSARETEDGAFLKAFVSFCHPKQNKADAVTYRCGVVGLTKVAVDTTG